jgi:hypothetical protein
MDPPPRTLAEPEIYARLLRALGAVDEAQLAPLRAAAAEGRERYAEAFGQAVIADPRMSGLAPYVLYETLGPALPGGAAAAAALWGLAHRCAMSYPEAVRRAGHADGEALFEAILRTSRGSRSRWMAATTCVLRLQSRPPGGPATHPRLCSPPASGAPTPGRSLWRPSSSSISSRISGAIRAVVTTSAGTAETTVEVTGSMLPGHVSLPNGQGLDYPDSDGVPVLTGVAANELTSLRWRDPLAERPWHKHVSGAGGGGAGLTARELLAQLSRRWRFVASGFAGAKLAGRSSTRPPLAEELTMQGATTVESCAVPRRRRGITRLAVGIVAIVAGCALAGCASAAGNPIQIENAKPGTSAWQLPGGRSTSILGYASQISVQPGDTLQMHVSTTPAANYRLEIYRLGWYGGAGGRLITCLPSCTTDEPGTQQSTPAPDPTTGYLDAGWPVTDTTTVGSSWTTGYYVAKLKLTTGPQAGQGSYIPFIVRSVPGTTSAILVQASVNTWEAYNDWGGKSLYGFNSTGHVAATQVSFNRPFGADPNDGPMAWEYPAVRFLERKGYDVSYQTDVDTDQNPASLQDHHLDIASGHDEYWSKAMRDGWEAARAAGVNLVFLGGDMGTWQLRYANSSRTLLEYRSAKLDPNPNPAAKTVLFSRLSPPRPECTLLGVGFTGGAHSSGAPPASYVVTQTSASNAWFKGTGLNPGISLYDTVGYEWDAVQPGCAVPPPQVLLHYAGSPANADAVTYQASSGSRIFSSASMQLVWALDDYGTTPHVDARVQQMFTNMFDDLGGGAPGTAPTGPPVDSTPPNPFPLSSPGARAVLWSPRPKLTWKPSSDSGSGLAPYVVVIDGRPVGHTNSTSYTPMHDLGDGRHTWTVVASDRAGNARRTSTRSLVVSSVRIKRRSHRQTLAHGFVVLFYCVTRCSGRVTLQDGRKGPTLRAVRSSRHGGIVTVGLSLTGPFSRVLAQHPSARLSLNVRTRSGHTTRRVNVSFAW